MTIQRAEIELKNRDKDYSELLKHWKKAISKVSENSSNTGLSSYTVVIGTEEHELRFSIFGIIHVDEYDRVHLVILGTHAAEFLKASYRTGANE